MIRTPVVANQFYPGDPLILENTLKDLIPEQTEPKPAIAVLSPHAGYIYSGSVAGETFANSQIPQDVVILGPNHHGQGAPIALMNDGEWQTPLGNVKINNELAALIAKPPVEIDDLAHRFEHSLEVQVPFLQYLRKNVSIVPLVISHIPYSTCVAVGKILALAIKEYAKPVLIVASTDMTHYEPRESAARKDHLALDHIKSLDPQGLYNTVVEKRISMCGIMPSTIALAAAMELGATKSNLIRYTDSGEVSGDTDHVVGYAGVLIS
ncbi:MAG: AmmeMemoRadiSam system protein B [Desulfobulbaceae bacterium]|nr:AmmeMemoRadiSam system protein B [Desulfobulbaceae bacterium]